MSNEKKIPFRIPPDMGPLKNRQKEFAASLELYTVEYLKKVHESLIGKVPAVRKAEFLRIIADALTFATADGFRQWFGLLPPLTQNVLYRLAFTDFLPASVIEKEFKETFLIKDKRYEWDITIKINDKLNLDFLLLDRFSDQYAFGLPLFLRKALSPWLEPPPEADIANCISEDAEPGWDNSQLIADSYPLFCDAVKQVYADISEHDRAKTARGLNKKQTTELRESSGFLDFGMERAYCPDSADLAFRFMVCMKNFKPFRPQDAHDDIRGMVTGFFSEESMYKKSWSYPDRNYLEAAVCIDHLTKTPGYYLGNYEGLPPSRKTFHEILLAIAQNGRRFDVDKLAEHIRINAKNFYFCGSDYESTLKIKAPSLSLEGITYTCDRYSDFRAIGILRHHLLVKPVFKAYCYIFAALGLLEITQQIPPLALSKGNKRFPISPYDSLKTIRITQFGLWCLGLSSKRPPKTTYDYQAIADKELLLVTVQGKSLERTVYLDRIGVKLGEDRWRVSPASFIAGCETPKQIDDRIARFKTLIDPAPAPHWLELFDKVVSRVGLFSHRRTDVLVYDLPEDRKVTEELLRDPELKNIALRAEGGLLVVPAKNYKKFLVLLNEHGIVGF
jgi:hypothetical protein